MISVNMEKKKLENTNYVQSDVEFCSLLGIKNTNLNRSKSSLVYSLRPNEKLKKTTNII